MSAMALHPGQLPVARAGVGRPAAARPAAARPAARPGAGRAAERDGRPRARLRLTPRGRAVFVALGLLLAAALVLLGSQAAANGPVSGVEVQRHVVAPGETLWQIAAGVTPRGHDVRDTVAELVRLNDLPGGGLRAGQVVLVPVD